jgi:hypothetical protein
MGFQLVQGTNNSIRLKELQVVSGALEKRGQKVRNFLFQKGFCWVRKGG